MVLVKRQDHSRFILPLSGGNSWSSCYCTTFTEGYTYRQFSSYWIYYYYFNLKRIKENHFDIPIIETCSNFLNLFLTKFNYLHFVGVMCIVSLNQVDFTVLNARVYTITSTFLLLSFWVFVFHGSNSRCIQNMLEIPFPFSLIVVFVNILAYIKIIDAN